MVNSGDVQASRRGEVRNSLGVVFNDYDVLESTAVAGGVRLPCRPQIFVSDVLARQTLMALKERL